MKVTITIGTDYDTKFRVEQNIHRFISQNQVLNTIIGTKIQRTCFQK